MNITPKLIALTIALVTFSSALFIVPGARAADIEGASDHPLVARVAGSEILIRKNNFPATSNTGMTESAFALNIVEKTKEEEMWKRMALHKQRILLWWRVD